MRSAKCRVQNAEWGVQNVEGWRPGFFPSRSGFQPALDAARVLCSYNSNHPCSIMLSPGNQSSFVSRFWAILVGSARSRQIAGAVLLAGFAIGHPAECQPLPTQDDWPCYGRDPGGMRYSPLTQIDRQNVVRLKV